jgi:hypothetical protein
MTTRRIFCWKITFDSQIRWKTTFDLLLTSILRFEKILQLLCVTHWYCCSVQVSSWRKPCSFGFQGSTVWVAKSDTEIRGPVDLSQLFPGLPDTPWDNVFARGTNINFISGPFTWVYDVRTDTIFGPTTGSQSALLTKGPVAELSDGRLAVFPRSNEPPSLQGEAYILDRFTEKVRFHKLWHCTSSSLKTNQFTQFIKTHQFIQFIENQPVHPVHWKLTSSPCSVKTEYFDKNFSETNFTFGHKGIFLTNSCFRKFSSVRWYFFLIF